MEGVTRQVFNPLANLLDHRPEIITAVRSPIARVIAPLALRIGVVRIELTGNPRAIGLDSLAVAGWVGLGGRVIIHIGIAMHQSRRPTTRKQRFIWRELSPRA
ncbi:hypothetical protein Hgul01_05090 [Herpetosiphon gulosus]|uniref:Uncharacterized protein n=1 Tax=Herpetosiphon gulosus TaxID=1973496 RepID=A0ABP9X9P1_9CHLR